MVRCEIPIGTEEVEYNIHEMKEDSEEREQVEKLFSLIHQSKFTNDKIKH